MNVIDQRKIREAERNRQLKHQAERILNACDRPKLQIVLTAAMMRLCDGEPTSAIVLTILLGWVGKGDLPEGHIAKSISKLSGETMIKSESALLTARKHLIQLGLVSTKRGTWANSPTTIWHVNLDEIEARLQCNDFVGLVDWTETSDNNLNTEYVFRVTATTQVMDETTEDDLALLEQMVDVDARCKLELFINLTAAVNSRIRLNANTYADFAATAQSWQEFPLEVIERTVTELLNKQYRIKTPSSINTGLRFTVKNMEREAKRAERAAVQAEKPEIIDLSFLGTPERIALAEAIRAEGIPLNNQNRLLTICGSLERKVQPYDIHLAANYRRANGYMLTNVEDIKQSAEIQAHLRRLTSQTIPAGVEGYYDRDGNKDIFVVYLDNRADAEAQTETTARVDLDAIDKEILTEADGVKIWYGCRVERTDTCVTFTVTRQTEETHIRAALLQAASERINEVIIRSAYNGQTVGNFQCSNGVIEQLVGDFVLEYKQVKAGDAARDVWCRLAEIVSAIEHPITPVSMALSTSKRRSSRQYSRKIFSV
jgi:hypothetical protein